MYFDYWHIKRYLCLSDMDPDDTLPFGAPPVVLGSVVSLPEPVWMTAIATIATHATEDFFQYWNRKNPLPTSHATKLLSTVRMVIQHVSTTGIITRPSNIAEVDQIDTDTVLTALHALSDLLALSIERKTTVKTWAA